MINFVLDLLLWASMVLPQQSPHSNTIGRPCTDSWNDSGSDSKKNRPKKEKKEPAKEAGACLELAFSPLEIQEYLESYARTQLWKITSEQVTEDSWTFSLELDKAELLRNAKTDPNAKGVDWTGGVARVHVSTVQLADRFARTVIRASFRGYGRSADQFAMQKEYWQLESNNSFENSLISALRVRFAGAQ